MVLSALLMDCYVEELDAQPGPCMVCNDNESNSTYIKYAVIVCNSIESPSGEYRATLIRTLF